MLSKLIELKNKNIQFFKFLMLIENNFIFGALENHFSTRDTTKPLVENGLDVVATKGIWVDHLT